MQFPLDKVIVGQRARKDLGDLSELKLSMAAIGLLQPIGISRENRLVFGARRLEAARDLGWSAIEVRVVDLDNPLQAELDENECRKEFTVSEKVAIAKAIEEREREKARGRQRAAGGDKSASENFSQALSEEPGRAKDKAAAAVDMSRPTYEKAKEVVEQGTPDDVIEMDATGKVNGVHQRVTGKGRKAKAHVEADEAQPERPAKDAVGHAIPEKAAAAFETAGAIGALCRDLDAIIQRVQELGEAAGGRLMHTPSQVQSLRAVRKSLWGSRATHVCPYCRGTKAECTGCASEGWVSTMVYEQAPEEKRLAMVAAPF